MSELKQGDYGYRRKRNLNLPEWSTTSRNNTENVSGINWNEKRSEIDHRHLEDDEIIEAPENKRTNKLYINNKEVDIEKIQIQNKELELQKITIYLDENLIITLKLLKSKKIIESYSKCISQSLIEYLTK